uniref:Uncharacterized protein n=1 Tax=Salix viminalis TaxID=40686 RepID=A0A6N2K631_SALVM
MRTQMPSQNVGVRYNKLGQKLARKAIFYEEVKLRLESILCSGMEDSRPLLDRFSDVGVLKIVGFQELDDRLGLMETPKPAQQELVQTFCPLVESPDSWRQSLHKPSYHAFAA